MLAVPSTVVPVPPMAGVGLRPAHYEQVLSGLPAVPWFEVHSENFFCEGGELLAMLESVRRHYPLSLHGVGLYPGSPDGLDGDHLARLGRLVRRVEPGLVSEHLCWGRVDGHCMNELLPLPYTEEALRLAIERVGQIQDALGRQILIENVSSYIAYRHSTLTEWTFLSELARHSGCGLLLDINNVYVNSVNHGFDPADFLRGVPPQAIGEMHLAGFTRKDGLAAPLLIDSHSRRVDAAVWCLYREAVSRFGPVPTLIEWDQDLPAFDVLLDEARLAEEIMDDYRTIPA